MPELAEVVYFSRQWDAALHKRILRVHVNPKARVFRGGDAKLIAKALTGSEYLWPFTHGKNMLFQFSGGDCVGGHLGMTGELLAVPPDHAPQKHERLVFMTSDAGLVVRDPRMFELWRIDRGPEPPEWWRALPTEITGKTFTPAHVE